MRTSIVVNLSKARWQALRSLALPIPALAADNPDMQAVLSQVPKMHDENVKHLQEWIALPSIAAENRNYPQGPEYMAKLAREAGFTNVEIVPTSGKPGVFGMIDAGAPTTRRHLLHVRREAV